jgi:hypothetical protein
MVGIVNEKSCSEFIVVFCCAMANSMPTKGKLSLMTIIKAGVMQVKATSANIGVLIS